MNAALILAGGKGERLIGRDKPKQFVEVGGEPLIAHGLRSFEACAEIARIVVVAEDRWRGLISKCVERNGISKFVRFADAGAARQESVFSGLLAMEDFMRADDLAVVHDAARPAVTERLIRACVAEAARRDGATPVLPVRETIYRSEDGRGVSGLLDRDELFVGQTPEAYKFEKYLAAHREATREELARTRGGSEIAFRFGMDIGLFPGDEANFKITARADLERFERSLERGPEAE
ncbi:MAG: 2-C-methyl-D-erythritol 4-phosphate cytidylyltransferase [Clostridiales Family XIII bacterium]|jgi:2-C-methyl-D-erythritol 4-phosphate cytidylyltransferase|nr:2-C-methyl-D-erythritol 4-phosphate cytidylyltransferase [Clostridiales Family XIII bacterium]